MEAPFGEEKGQRPSAPLCAASAAITRVSDESPAGPRRHLSAGSGHRPPARPRIGETPSPLDPGPCIPIEQHVANSIGVLDTPARTRRANTTPERHQVTEVFWKPLVWDDENVVRPTFGVDKRGKGVVHFDKKHGIVRSERVVLIELPRYSHAVLLQLERVEP